MSEAAGSDADHGETTEELARARARIEELERQLTEQVKNAEHIRRLISLSPIVIYTARPHDLHVTYMSENITRWLGYTPEEFMANPELWPSLIHAEDSEHTLQAVAQLHAQGQVSMEYRFRHKDGSYRWVHDDMVSARDGDGNVVEFIGFWGDITDRKRTEEVILRQSDALREMSTPLIPISQRVVAMPLVGVMDSHRAQQVLETLLEGIGRTGAQVAIIDITGVGIVDTHVANALVQSAKAAQLMGTQVVLTGIRPEVAQILVAIQADLGGIVTQGTLQAGIAYASRVARA